MVFLSWRARDHFHSSLCKTMCFFTLTIHPFPHLLMLYLWHHNCTSIKTLTCNSEERLLHRSNPEKKPGCLTRGGVTCKFSNRHLPSCCISHTNTTSFCYIYLPSPSTTGESDFSQLISANVQLPHRNYVLFIQTAAQPSTSCNCCSTCMGPRSMC